jgi:hypothetical protein
MNADPDPALKINVNPDPEIRQKTKQKIFQRQSTGTVNVTLNEVGTVAFKNFIPITLLCFLCLNVCLLA